MSNSKVKFKTDVVYKITQEAKGKELELGNLYFKNVPVTFAQVLKAGKKYNSDDKAYQLNLFIDSDTMDNVNDIGLNKEFAEVGVTKIKKGKNRGEIKYKLDEHNKPFENMFAVQVTRETVKRDKDGVIVKEYLPLKVVDSKGEPFTQEVGNGSICHVKLFAYRNEEGMLTVMMDTVVVLEHVVYTKNSDFFDEELGFNVKAPEEAEIDEELEIKQAKKTPNKQKSVPAEFEGFDLDTPF